MIRKLLPVLMALACASGPGQAAQIQARDGATVEAYIAKDAPTRIRIEGDRIVDVVGNIQSSSNCEAKPAEPGPTATPVPAMPQLPPVNPRGELVLSCDLTKGEVFVSPVAGTSRPISLFVSSARATYTLLLRKADIPADTIVIHDRTRAARADLKAPPRRAAGHVRALKAMLVAMASDRASGDHQVDDTERPMALWREAEFRLVRTVYGRELAGETYRLKNISALPMVLAEQEFDREEGQVLAVAIDHLNLLPGETTAVHVIRYAGDAK
ncbi:type-F conjugative transfer system secretin TraK [Massilia sp. BJB1822]|uniref:type-F conjugative transfer system secretin TraK n=1 Tax=Massilia sp. BJB1822 TaxID=2744470 RepID=UPI001C3E7F58|nr:type-F conjugative transfer system secretin TraK [Massilia sp. BJB1822]